MAPAAARTPYPAAAHQPEFALDVAAVLERTLSAWRANLVPFTILATILLGPAHLIQFFVQSNTAAGNVMLDRVFVALLISFVAKMVLTGAIPFGVFEHMRGHDPDVPSILGAGLSRLLAVIGTAVVTTIAVGISAIAFCIPALFVAAMYYVAVPVTVIEEENPFNAISRSYNLTKGNVLRILGLYVLLAVALGVAALVLRLGLGMAIGSPHGVELLANLILLPIASIEGIACAVTYHDLRVGREHSSVDDLVRVFE